MKNKVIWLRISYWTGAMIDALAAILLTFPALNAFFYGLEPLDLTSAFRSVDFSAAALMWGWTFLLVWADHKPLERSGVIMLTVFPVLFLMLMDSLIDIVSNGAPSTAQVFVPIMQLTLVGLFSFSYWVNHRRNVQ